MKFWGVRKENNVYTFYALNKGISDEGINAIIIKLKPQYWYSEIHARTYNQKTYIDILNAGKAHALEKNPKSQNGKYKSYYFDSLYASFAEMSDELVESTLSDKYLMLEYLERNIAHIAEFKDHASGARNIEESLSVLVKADKNVEEIVEFMRGEFAAQLVGNHSLFSDTMRDKKSNLDVLSSDSKEQNVLKK